MRAVTIIFEGRVIVDVPDNLTDSQAQEWAEKVWDEGLNNLEDLQAEIVDMVVE